MTSRGVERTWIPTGGSGANGLTYQNLPQAAHGKNRLEIFYPVSLQPTSHTFKPESHSALLSPSLCSQLLLHTSISINFPHELNQGIGSISTTQKNHFYREITQAQQDYPAWMLCFGTSLWIQIPHDRAITALESQVVSMMTDNTTLVSTV